MKNYLVKETANYADEFDIQGFIVFTEFDEKEDLIQSLIHDRKFPIECYFGTNEYTDFQNKKQFLDALEIKEITNEELELLKKLFPDCTRYAFGTTSIL